MTEVDQNYKFYLKILNYKNKKIKMYIACCFPAKDFTYIILDLILIWKNVI